MTKIDLSLDLPDRIARDARDSGLLSPPALAQMLRAELRRQAATRLVKGPCLTDEPLTMAEIQCEVTAVRKERRSNVG